MVGIHDRKSTGGSAENTAEAKTKASYIGGRDRWRRSIRNQKRIYQMEKKENKAITPTDLTRSMRVVDNLLEIDRAGFLAS